MARRLVVSAVAAFGLLVFAGNASAEQLGITAPPSGASPLTGPCSAFIVGQATDTSATPYIIPAGGGEITQWQTYTVGDTAGSSITFAVLRPTSSSTWGTVGFDTVTLPTPLPTSHIASFTLSTPIKVQAGDTLASQTSNVCYYMGGSTPSGDVLFSAFGTVPPTVGEAFSFAASSGAGFALNLAATLSQTVDAGVQTSTFPSTTDVASAALLSSTVTNAGPNAAPITFTDQVPSGLRVVSASTAAGTCAVSGQTVTCTISGLLAGQSTTVNVVVMASKTGSYANDVSVNVPSAATDPGVTDPNSANNIASDTLTFTALPQKCVVPGLRKATMATARTLLGELGCRVGFVRQHSSIKKGLVIGVRGGVGTYPYKQLVTVLVSSGKKKKK